MRSDLESYEPAVATVVTLDSVDVITSSIGIDAGENDGEWTPYGTPKANSSDVWG